MNSKSDVYDAVVIGAGPAGSAAAATLAQRGRRVALVGTVRPARRQVGESLPGSARPLLRTLGFLPAVEAGPHLPSYGNAFAWGSSELAATDFIRDPQGPGWHLDRPRFDADLRAAAQSAGAAWHQARVRSVVQVADGWRLRADGGDLQANWIIDATGRGAACVRRLGAVRVRDDDLVALYAWAQTDAADQDTRSLVESAPIGWWYTARLKDKTRIVVLHARAADAARIQATPGAWHSLLQETLHVGRHIGASSLITTPRPTEACGAQLVEPSGLRWVAAGDAALSFDPLSSQGIFHALYGGMKAGQAVDRALAGNADALRDYAARLTEIRRVYLARHGLTYATEQRWSDSAFWRDRSPAKGASFEASR